MTHDQIVAGCWAVAIFLTGLSLLGISKSMERRDNWRRMVLRELWAEAERNEAQRVDEAWADLVARLQAQDSEPGNEPTVEMDGLTLRAEAIEIPREGEPS